MEIMIFSDYHMGFFIPEILNFCLFKNHRRPRCTWPLVRLVWVMDVMYDKVSGWVSNGKPGQHIE